MKERTQTILFRITEDTDTHVGMMNILALLTKSYIESASPIIKPYHDLFKFITYRPAICMATKI